MSDPIALHYWPTPNGWKVSIALEEMGLPYEMVPVNIGAGEQFTPAFLAISPNNRMPAIVDPAGAGGTAVSIFESGAILQYLARKTGRFYGADARAAIEVDEWLFWQVGGLGPMAGQTNHFRLYAPTMHPDTRVTAYGAIRYTNETHRLFGVLDRRLQGRDFIAGDYSIADMACWPWMGFPARLGVDLAEFPNVDAWLQRVGERDAVKRGRALGEHLRTPVDAPGAVKERSVLFGRVPG